MKVKIRNIEPFKRSIPTPANTSIPVDGNTTVTFEYPDAFKDFFKSLEAYRFQVDIELSKDPNSQDTSEPSDEIKETKEKADKPEEDKPVQSDDKTEETTEDDSDDVLEKLQTLSEDELKGILNDNNVKTNATKKDTLITKVLENVKEEDIKKALN